MLKEQFGKLYSLENCSEVGIYKRKQESEKTRKLEKKKENKNSTKKMNKRKKKVFSFFSWSLS